MWCGDAFPHALPWFAFPVAGVACCLLLAFFHFTHRGLLFGLVAGAGVLCIGYFLAARQWQLTDYAFSGKPSVYKVLIQDKPEEKPRSLLCRSSLLEELDGDSILRDARASLFLLYFPKDSASATLRRGDVLLVQTTLAPPRNNGNPDEFDYVRFLRRRGGSGTAYVPAGHWQVVGHDSVRTFRQAARDCRDRVVELYRSLGFGGDELAVLSALSVGDQDKLSDDIVETYSVSGASHVLALSGLHIGFLYALLWFVFRLAWSRCRWLKFWLVLLIVLALWGFAFVAGLSSSVVRSVTMFSLLALSSLQTEKPLTLNTLAGTAFLMLLWRPSWLFDVGFQLSFLSVWAIVVIQPRLYALCRADNRLLKWLWGLATVSVSAQLATAPLVLLYFSRFSTHFLLTNLWVVPVSSLVMYAAVALLALTPFPFLQQAFAVWVEKLVWLQNRVLQAIEDLPCSSVDGVWVSTWEVWLFYLFVAAACYGYVRHRGRAVLGAWLLLGLFVAGHWVNVSLNKSRPALAFYNVRGCPAVHCLGTGGRSWLVCADSLPDVSRLQASLSAHWNRLGLETPRVVAGSWADENVTLAEGLATYAGRRICFVRDGRWKEKAGGQPPLYVDYLYVCRGYKGTMADLASVLSAGTVIVEPSYSAYYGGRIGQECRRLGIPCFFLDETGAFRVKL